MLYILGLVYYIFRINQPTFSWLSYNRNFSKVNTDGQKVYTDGQKVHTDGQKLCTDGQQV